MDLEEFVDNIIERDGYSRDEHLLSVDESFDVLSHVRTDGFSLSGGLNIVGEILSLGGLLGGHAAQARRKRRQDAIKARIMNLKTPEVLLAKDIIIIKYLMPSEFHKDMMRLYNTGRISHMFMDKKSVKFKSYFALDVYRSLMWMQDNPKINPVRKLRYKKTAELLLTLTWVGRADNEEIEDALDKKKLRNLNITLFDHQEPLIDFYNKTTKRLNTRGVIVSSTMGSGKTILSLAMAETLSAELVIIVCPLPTINKVWESTIKQIYKRKQNYYLTNGGTAPTRKTRFYVVHYEALTKFIGDTIPKIRKGLKTAVILDESHNLNSTTSIRTQRYLDLIDELDPAMVLPMSGTTLKAEAVELLPSFRAIDKSFTKDVAKSFKKVYAGGNTGCVRLLKERVRDLTYLVEKNEIGVEPPEKIEIPIALPNGNEYTLKVIKGKLTKYIIERKKHYAKTNTEDTKIFWKLIANAKEKAVQQGDNAWLDKFSIYYPSVQAIVKAEAYSELRDELKLCNKFEKETLPAYFTDAEKKFFKLIRTQVKYVELKVVGEALGNVLTKLRAQAHADMAMHTDFNAIIEASLSKTVIFFNSIEVGDTIMDILSDDYNPVGVYGAEAKQLNKHVAAFTKDPKVNPLVASFKTLGTGVPLVAASTAIVAEMPFRDYILAQGLARISRIGQKHPTTAVYIVLDTGTEPNISTRSKEIIEWAANAVKEITGVEIESNLVTEELAADPSYFYNL